MPSGFVTLGQIAAGLPVLDVACNRCDRRGRLLLKQSTCLDHC